MHPDFFFLTICYCAYINIMYSAVRLLSAVPLVSQGVCFLFVSMPSERINDFLSVFCLFVFSFCES